MPKAAINSGCPGRETEAGRLTQASGTGSCMSCPWQNKAVSVMRSYCLGSFWKDSDSVNWQVTKERLQVSCHGAFPSCFLPIHRHLFFSIPFMMSLVSAHLYMHSFIHEFIHLCVHWYFHSFMCYPRFDALTWSCIHSYIRLVIVRCWVIHSITHVSICALFNHSVSHAFTHLYMY